MREQQHSIARHAFALRSACLEGLPFPLRSLTHMLGARLEILGFYRGEGAQDVGQLTDLAVLDAPSQGPPQDGGRDWWESLIE